MINPESKLFCRLDGLTTTTREQQRLATLSEMGLIDAEMVPVFDEATQTTARFLDAPICILSIMTQERQLIKSAVGLSRIGLMNELAKARQLPRSESFCTYVVDSTQVLTIPDTVISPVFSKSILTQHYGIRSYLGVPLISASGQCLGTLAVMDLVPRNFNTKDIQFLELMARWSASEYERNQLSKRENISWLNKSPLGGQQEQKWDISSNSPAIARVRQSTTNSIKVKLLNQLSQELRTPLTSVMGMTSVLSREIYGPLSNKQKEYVDIIHNSGEHLVSLVDEILSLGVLDDRPEKLNITSVDVEMLCQQAINSLIQVAKQRQQQIRLSVEPGNRIWLLDKDKGRQMLYYLVYNLIQSSEAGGVVRIHVARKLDKLNLSVWVSHPWLGEGLPQMDIYQQPTGAIGDRSESMLFPPQPERREQIAGTVANAFNPNSAGVSVASPEGTNGDTNPLAANTQNSRESLGLLLSCHLAEIHGGHISVQGSSDTGYRYVIALPQLAPQEV